MLKPGQLCTIIGCIWNKDFTEVEDTKHIYRCVNNKENFDNTPVAYHLYKKPSVNCIACKKANNQTCCMLAKHGVLHPIYTCNQMFGLDNYPILVK